MAPRPRYSPELREQVLLLYPLCRGGVHREGLAERLGFGSLARMYNLASRLAATSEDAELAAAKAAADPERLHEREGLEAPWEDWQDSYLRDEFARRPIEQIAVFVGHTEIAVAYRARTLALRKLIAFWPAGHVAAWLGDRAVIGQLQRAGLVYPVRSLDGGVALTLVDARGLAGWVAEHQPAGIDPVFAAELADTAATSDADAFEATVWVSHDHRVLNPYSPAYGMFAPAGEDRVAGIDPTCKATVELRVQDLAPGDL